MATLAVPIAIPTSAAARAGGSFTPRLSAPLEDDLAANTVLVDPEGRTHAPLAWRGDGPGSHHLKGVLAFAPITPRPAAIELRLQRRGEPGARSFKWTLLPP